MKTILKNFLYPLGIIIATIVCVTVIYNLITELQINRALRHERTHTNCAVRGKILDVNYNELATFDTIYNSFIDCTILSDEEWERRVEPLAAVLANVFPRRDSCGWFDYLQAGRADNNKYRLIAYGLTQEELAVVKSSPMYDSRRSRTSGIIDVVIRRSYPYGSLAKSTIGYLKDNDLSDFGLENSCNDILSGVDGKTLVRTGAYETKTVRREKVIVPVKNGSDIHTTLSIESQIAADSALLDAFKRNMEIESGCLVIMDINSGAIRAMANLTRDDSHGVAETGVNVAIHRLYEPGIIAQPKILAPLLEDGFVKSFDEYLSGCPTNELARTPSGDSLFVTPLTLLSFYNAVANRGMMEKPYLIEKVDGYKPENLSSGHEEIGQIIPASVADSLYCALDIFTSKQLSRRSSYKQPLFVGTSGAAYQLMPDYLATYCDANGNGAYAATCVGFFPISSPQYSIMCALFSKPTNKKIDWAILPVSVIQDYINR